MTKVITSTVSGLFHGMSAEVTAFGKTFSGWLHHDHRDVDWFFWPDEDFAEGVAAIPDGAESSSSKLTIRLMGDNTADDTGDITAEGLILIKGTQDGGYPFLKVRDEDLQNLAAELYTNPSWVLPQM